MREGLRTNLTVPMIWQSTGAGMQARAVENSKMASCNWCCANVLMSSRTSLSEPDWEFLSHTKLMVKVSRVPAEGRKKSEMAELT